MSQACRLVSVRLHDGLYCYCFGGAHVLNLAFVCGIDWQDMKHCSSNRVGNVASLVRPGTSNLSV